MATPAKKREIDEQSDETNELPSSDDSNDESDMDTNDEQEAQIVVDFVGRIPEDTDFHGIKILLQQLFLKAHVNVSALANFIIGRNYVGSVIKQGPGEDEDDNDDETDINDVFGITTVINISHGQNEECIKQLRSLLQELASDYASDTANGLIKSILENDSAALGLIVNERFVNIPADISVPLLENLIADMKRAVGKKMPYDFQYYILIAKLYKPKTLAANNSNKKTKKKNLEEPDLIWSNGEEEIFSEDAICSFEFSVAKESDTALSGTWAEDDDEMIPHRRVMIFEANKLPSIIEKIKTALSD